MFSYIKGRLECKTSTYLVVEANGVGYKVFSALSTLDKISAELCSEVKIYTHLYVREDAMILFGFLTQEELNIFELLIAISGVGPKAAISIISCIPVSRFAMAVITDDVTLFTKAQGIGKKTAQRIILELKDKLKKESLTTTSTAVSLQQEQEYCASSFSEAVSALMVLGYSSVEANKAVTAIYSEEDLLEDIIMKALKIMAL